MTIVLCFVSYLRKCSKQVRINTSKFYYCPFHRDLWRRLKYRACMIIYCTHYQFVYISLSCICLLLSVTVLTPDREHAGRAKKGMQLMVLPLYGGLPYSEQVSSSAWCHGYQHCLVTTLPPFP